MLVINSVNLSSRLNLHLMPSVPSKRFVDQRRIHSERCDTAKLLQCHSIESITEPLQHHLVFQEAKIPRFVSLAVLVRCNQFMHLCSDSLVGRTARSNLCEDCEGTFGLIWMLLQKVSRAIAVMRID